MAQPAALLERLVLQSVPNCPQKPIEDLQRESCAGLAIDRCGDVERGRKQAKSVGRRYGASCTRKALSMDAASSYVAY
jgi:hypothetical protein